MLKIEKNVAIPSKSGVWKGDKNSISAAIKRLMASDLGDSVLFPFGLKTSRGLDISLNTLGRLVNTIGGTGGATIRKTDDGWRIWKIGQPKKNERSGVAEQIAAQ